MKRNLLLIALLAASGLAHATDRGNDKPNSNTVAAASANAQANAVNLLTGGVGYGGDTSVNVDNDTKMPASSAISPAVGTGNDCQIATPSSKAFSVLIFSASGTTGVTYNDLCFAYKMKQFDVAEKLMCQKSQDYAKANPRCK